MTNKVLELIRRQFTLIQRNNTDYEGVNLQIANEQQYVENKSRLKPDTLYIVVKFMPGSVNFGQNTIPVTFNVISTYNQIETCQQLLLEYITQYNLTRDASKTILQTYTTASVSSNFNDVFEGYRSLYYFTGTFIISENALNSTITYKGEVVENLTNNMSITTNLDTQPFYTTHNFTKSEVLTGTFVLSISTFFINNTFCTDVFNAIMGVTPNVNNSFVFELSFKGINAPIKKTLKLVNWSFQENIGEIPVASMTFTE